MTPTEFVLLPDTVTCLRCQHEQDPYTPVAVVATWDVRSWFGCTGCVREVEGAAA